MGIPKFPKLPEAPDQEQVLLQLLHTVALEELALAALIHAEAEKVQAVAAAGIMGPTTPEDVAEINRAVAEVMREVAGKQDRLLRKLATILAAKDQDEDDHDDNDCNDDDGKKPPKRRPKRQV